MNSVEKQKVIIEKLKEAYGIISECENFCPEFFEEYERRMREEDYIPSEEEDRFFFEELWRIGNKISDGVACVCNSIKTVIAPLEGEIVELKNGEPLFVYNGRIALQGAGYVNYQIYPREGNPYVTVVWPDGPRNAVRDVDVREIAICKDEEKRKAVFESAVRAKWS